MVAEDAWFSGYDFDDFFLKFGIYDKPAYKTRYQVREDAKTILYKVMIAIILTCLHNTPLLDNSIISDFIEEASNHSKYKGDLSPLDQQISNISLLREVLTTWPTARKMGITHEMTIYRGFDQPRYEQLFAIPLTDSGRTLQTIKKNEIITIPTFLSTSVLRNTALRFATDNYYLWEITIPKDKLHLFKYVYLGDEVNLDDSTSILEAEILLNIGTQLKYLSEEKTDEEVILPRPTTTQGPQGGTYRRPWSCILQRFEFVGYGDVDLSFLDTCLDEGRHKRAKGTLRKKRKKQTKARGKNKMKKKKKRKKKDKKTKRRKTH